MVASIALCFIPLIAVYLCFAILVKDFNKWSGLLACLLGLIAFAPIMAIDFVKDPYLGGSQFSQLLKFFLLALVEEGIKMVLMFFLPSKKSSQLVFVSYAILLGMTLGCFETLLYLIVIVSRTGFRWWAIIIHLVCSGLSGIFVYSIRKKNLLITPFLFAVLFHGVYNYFADFIDFRKYFSLAVMLIALVELKLRYEVLKSDLIENKLSNNLEKDKSKGVPKNMGVKDFFKGLFGRKEEKNDVPEQSVFNSTQVSASEFDSGKTEEAAGLATNKQEETVVATVVSTAEKVVSTTSSLLNSKDEKKEEKPWGSLLSKEPTKFVDDPVVVDEPIEEVPVPAPLKAEPVAETKTVAEEKPATEKKTRTRTTGTKTAAKDSESKPATKSATKKTAEKKATDSTTAETKTPAKRGRKPAAEKTETTVASTPAKRGRKPAASKTIAEEKKTEETKSTTKKTGTSKSATTKTATTKAATSKTVAEEKKPEETKSTAKKTSATKASTTKASEKSDATKTPAKKTTAKKATDSAATETKTPAKRGRKPAAKNAVSETVEEVKTVAKKAASTAKKVADTAEKVGAEVKAAAKKTTKKADGEKAPAKKPAAKKTTAKKAEEK